MKIWKGNECCQAQSGFRKAGVGWIPLVAYKEACFFFVFMFLTQWRSMSFPHWYIGRRQSEHFFVNTKFTASFSSGTSVQWRCVCMETRRWLQWRFCISSPKSMHMYVQRYQLANMFLIVNKWMEYCGFWKERQQKSKNVYSCIGNLLF